MLFFSLPAFVSASNGCAVKYMNLTGCCSHLPCHCLLLCSSPASLSVTCLAPLARPCAQIVEFHDPSGACVRAKGPGPAALFCGHCQSCEPPQNHGLCWRQYGVCGLCWPLVSSLGVMTPADSRLWLACVPCTLGRGSAIQPWPSCPADLALWTCACMTQVSRRHWLQARSSWPGATLSN